MILEGIVIAPRWSVTSDSVVGVVVKLFVLELLSQTKAVLHLMFGVLVKRARAIKDLLVLFVVVALGVRLTDGGDDVVWPAAVILARLGSFCSIMAAVTMVTTVVVAVVVVASVIGSVVIAACWAMNARILIDPHLDFLGISVLVGSSDHLADASG